MESKERQSSAAPMLLAFCVFVALLPLLYVAALGPIIRLGEHGYISVEDDSVAAKAYFPLKYLMARSKAVEASVVWYATLWSSPPPQPQPYTY